MFCRFGVGSVAQPDGCETSNSFCRARVSYSAPTPPRQIIRPAQRIGRPRDGGALDRLSAMSLAERADRLPTTPGVYLFKSARGSVLYVGKAQNLRSRVKQYVLGGDGRITIPKLLDRAHRRRRGGDAEREGRAAARERADQAPQAAVQRAAARRQAVSRAAARRARDVGAPARGAQVRRRRRGVLRAVHVEHRDARGALEPAADLPAAVVQRGHVQGLRAARPAVHRVRDEALPRAVLRARRRRGLCRSRAAARRCSCAGSPPSS